VLDTYPRRHVRSQLSQRTPEVQKALYRADICSSSASVLGRTIDEFANPASHGTKEYKNSQVGCSADAIQLL
jgi:hypothetical protein